MYLSLNAFGRLGIVLLALLLVAFAAAWISLPTSGLSKVGPPASWFAGGLTKFTPAGTERVFVPPEPISRIPSLEDTGRYEIQEVGERHVVQLGALKSRIKIAFASAAGVVLLLGIAFGRTRRRQE